MLPDGEVVERVLDANLAGLTLTQADPQAVIGSTPLLRAVANTGMRAVFGVEMSGDTVRLVQNHRGPLGVAISARVDGMSIVSDRGAYLHVTPLLLGSEDRDSVGVTTTANPRGCELLVAGFMAFREKVADHLESAGVMYSRPVGMGIGQEDYSLRIRWEGGSVAFDSALDDRLSVRDGVFSFDHSDVPGLSVLSVSDGFDPGAWADSVMSDAHEFHAALLDAVSMVADVLSEDPAEE